MSKAFTRESDDAPEQGPGVRPVPVLPPGVRNYITPRGAEALRKELAQGSTEQRAAEIQRILSSATVQAPPAKPWDEVAFGATVSVRESDGSESEYRLVGADETDLERNWINWYSPLGRALLKGRVGQRVRLRAPGGDRELEILRITYE